MSGERENQRLKLTRLAGPMLIAAAGVAGLWWSWGAWPDVLIDFGRELYVPWRLAEGQVLYRDVIAFNGPLSHYAVALWFFCFGVSLRSLVVLNGLILIGVIWLLYRIFLHIAGRGAATLACLTFLGLLAFSQITFIGNYNWLCPYAHENTHGLALSLLALYLLFRYAEGRRLIWLGGSGFVLGLVFLTKAEIFVAVTASSAVAMAAMWRLDQPTLGAAMRAAGVWAGLAVAPVIVSVLLLATAMPASDAINSTMGSWPYVLNAQNTDFPFYTEGMGTDNPAARIGRILICAGWQLLLFAPPAVLAMFCRRRNRTAWIMTGTVFVAITALMAYLAFAHPVINWEFLATPWPLWLLLIAVMAAWPVMARRCDRDHAAAATLKLAMAVLAMGLLAKMILNTRIYHYGFTLAMPATLMIVAALWTWIPRALAALGGQAMILRAAVLATWLVTISVHIGVSNRHFENKDHFVGTNGPDAFRADIRGLFVNQTLDFLEQHAAPGDTLVTLPDGIMINYLLRMVSPTPYTQYSPMMMRMYGEARMLDSFRRSPPDWIVLVHNDDSPYGAQFFGRDYGLHLKRWFDEHYAPVHLANAPPFEHPDKFGILTLRRRAPGGTR